ncbi:MAG: hypothetical protein A3K19_09575 [Lentisphaerae bacterium RIFOXYB12_FULL_65_16]|nr:MAG: hypothetical protein A3K18_03595 [Lentisphaerae bacterium RIFOXYA12_64_32]OGV90500.1 MAG: hypothetical protein A3K19_09575 [Lentisphaerae bacterium RIFOXYB12_FULL_65_16]
MKKGVCNTVVLVALGLGILTTAGCKKTKKIDPNYGGLPAPMGAGMGGLPGAAGGVDGAGGDWQALGGPLGGKAGSSITPVKDARWDGVVVYFAYDSAAIGPSERPKLDVLAGCLKENPTYAVCIEGNCDDRGSDEYNRALSESRAIAVRDYLVSLGIDASRTETVGYGEEKPAVPNPQSEEDHQKNRRAEFVIGTRQ